MSRHAAALIVSTLDPAGAPAAFMLAGGQLLELNVQRPSHAAFFAGDTVIGGKTQSQYPAPAERANWKGLVLACATQNGGSLGV